MYLSYGADAIWPRYIVLKRLTVPVVQNIYTLDTVARPVGIAPETLEIFNICLQQ